MITGYQDYARLIAVSCIATILRNFPMTSLHGEEIEDFSRIQSFSIDLMARCFDDAGFE